MIDQPMAFEEAIRFLLDKDPNPEEWDSADWATEKPAVRVRSFFSSRVESARFLDRAQGLIFDYMAKVRDDLPNGERALRVGGREDFVMLMRRFMIEEGMAKPDEFQGVNQADLQDIRSVSRLRLIFDTNVRQAYGYGQWRQGMKPAVRRAFPAARFVRDRGVLEPRPRHAAHLGEVRLKTDLDWWARYQNDPKIGGFGVPWGPYGFYSGMGQEDVTRAEAQRLGLKVEPSPEEDAKPLPGLNDALAASVRKMDPDVKAKLLAELRGGPKPRDAEEAGREAAAAARRAALERRGLPAEPPVKVIEDGETIRLGPASGPSSAPGKILSPAPTRTSVPPLPDESSESKPGVSPETVLSDLRGIRDAEPGSSGLAREIRSRREAESLVAWADERGLLVERETPPREDDLTGGEHLVDLNEEEGLVFKATKPGKFGFAADREMIRPRGRRERPRITVGLADGTPAEYLARLEWQNQEFADDIRVLAVAKYPSGVSVLTSQPFYRGKRTPQAEIDQWFSEMGWKPISGREGAFYHQEKDLLILDALPRNVLTLEDGQTMPFDVVIARPDSDLKSSLRL